MLYLDYLKTENAWLDKANDEQMITRYLDVQLRGQNLPDGSQSKVTEALEHCKTTAFRNAPVADGRFPVLLFSPGGTTPGYLYSILAEYLAARGFIVVAYSSIGKAPGERWFLDEGGPQDHVDDMQLIVNRLTSDLPEADMSRIVCLAISASGISQTLLFLHDFPMKLMISLDSGLGNTYAIDMLKEFPEFSFSKITVPYVHVVGLGPARYDVEKTRVFYDSIAAKNKLFISFTHLSHHHFNPFGGIVPPLLAGTLDREVWESFKEMSRTLVLVVRESLTDGTADFDRVKSVLSGLPAERLKYVSVEP